MVQSPSPSPDLLRAINETDLTPSSDKLDAIRAAASEARDLDAAVKDLEERLSDLKARRGRILREQLPEMMAEAEMTEMLLASSGNLPGFRLKLVTEYRASISEKWSEERRSAAFNWLDARGAGDLISTAVSVNFPREERKTALELSNDLRGQGYETQLAEQVHWKTLTAWLREQVEAGATVPLDLIGGYIGRLVKIEQEDQ